MEKNKTQYPLTGEAAKTATLAVQRAMLAKAEREKQWAHHAFEQARHYLMVCTRQVEDLEAAIYFAGKEVSHG